MRAIASGLTIPKYLAVSDGHLFVTTWRSLIDVHLASGSIVTLAESQLALGVEVTRRRVFVFLHEGEGGVGRLWSIDRTSGLRCVVWEGSDLGICYFAGDDVALWQEPGGRLWRWADGDEAPSVFCESSASAKAWLPAGTVLFQEGSGELFAERRSLGIFKHAKFARRLQKGTLFFSAYTDETGDAVFALADGNVRQLAQQRFGPACIVADDHHVYWDVDGAGQVARVPCAGGAVEMVVETGDPYITCLEVDDQQLYVALMGVSEDTGSVLAHPKSEL